MNEMPLEWDWDKHKKEKTQQQQLKILVNNGDELFFSSPLEKM